MFLCLEQSLATLIWRHRPPRRSYCIDQLQVVDAAGRSDSLRLTNVLRSRTLSGVVSASQIQILSRTIVLQPDIERQTQCLPVDTTGLFHPRLESLFHPESGSFVRTRKYHLAEPMISAPDCSHRQRQEELSLISR